MMYQATIIIENAFKKQGLKCVAREAGPLSYVELSMSGSNTTVLIRFISSDNDNDVKVMTADFAKFPPNKLDVGYKLANQLSREYKYLKFTIDDNGDMCAQYDLPLRVESENLGPIAIELLMRFAKIVDDCYPAVMKTVWG